MNTKMLPQMIAMSLTAILFLGTGCATTKAEAPADAQAQNHEEHHPEGEAPGKNLARRLNAASLYFLKMCDLICLSKI